MWNFVTDDAFISFVYSRNLADHGELVFNLGERVEGYSNFLWTVLLAGLYKLGLLPEVTSRVVATALAVATLATTAYALRGVRREPWSAWHALPALLLAGSPGYACWSSGGLETQLFTFTTTLGVALYLVRGPGVGSGVALGLAALTRPEGTLWLVGLVGFHGLRRVLGRRAQALWPTRREWLWLAGFAALVVPHLLWRRSYYGWWLPNTFYTKTGTWNDGETWSQGWYYVSRFLVESHAWIALPLALAGAIVARGREGRTPLALHLCGATIAGGFLFYIASVGGDFMGLWRFAVPLLPLFALAAAAGAIDALRGRPPALALAVLAALLAGHAWHAVRVDRASLVIRADRGIDTPGYLRWYTADRAAIGKWFGERRLPGDYAVVGGAGAQVYYSGIPSLDCFGLSDSYIAHQVPATSKRPGHQKYAPLSYQLARKPSIITSSYYRIGKTPFVPSPGEAAAWKRRGYRYTSARIEGLSSPWYSFLVRLDRDLGTPAPER